jgi:hypothetical protein
MDKDIQRSSASRGNGYSLLYQWRSNDRQPSIFAAVSQAATSSETALENPESYPAAAVRIVRGSALSTLSEVST